MASSTDTKEQPAVVVQGEEMKGPNSKDRLLHLGDRRDVMRQESSALIVPQPLGTEYQFDGVPIVRSAAEIPDWARCDRCGTGQEDGARKGDLFRPCRCEGGRRYFHRGCFREWRQGWINPRNYFCCPECATPYRMERVRSSSVATEGTARILRHFRLRMAAFYLTMILLLVGTIGFVAGIAWAADRDEKNVPVGMKYMLTSVASGFPGPNATANWRENFKRPDVAVWPYYTLLGTLCAAVAVLVGFALVGCTFDEDERPRRTCGDQCCSSRGSHTTGDVYVYSYWGCYTHRTPCDGCFCPCDDSCRHCCSAHATDHGGAGDCHCCCTTDGSCHTPPTDCGDCKGDDALGALLALLLIVAVIILVSAIFVVILYAVKKWALFHDRMTDMLESQAAELESETIVLGIDETLRPVTEV